GEDALGLVLDGTLEEHIRAGVLAGVADDHPVVERLCSLAEVQADGLGGAAVTFQFDGEIETGEVAAQADLPDAGGGVATEDDPLVGDGGGGMVEILQRQEPEVRSLAQLEVDLRDHQETLARCAAIDDDHAGLGTLPTRTEMWGKDAAPGVTPCRSMRNGF